MKYGKQQESCEGNTYVFENQEFESESQDKNISLIIYGRENSRYVIVRRCYRF